MSTRSDRIIFLDFDEVISSKRWKLTLSKPHKIHEYDPEAVKRVAEIANRADAKIVVTSCARIGKRLGDLREMLILSGYPGICPIIDKTPVLSKSRGEEIQAWLNSYPWDIERFVIIDDSNDMRHLLPHLVRTEGEYGLTQEHVEKAVKMLMEKT